MLTVDPQKRITISKAREEFQAIEAALQKSKAVASAQAPTHDFLENKQ